MLVLLMCHQLCLLRNILKVVKRVAMTMCAPSVAAALAHLLRPGTKLHNSNIAK
jgi:hypothetical protein